MLVDGSDYKNLSSGRRQRLRSAVSAKLSDVIDRHCGEHANFFRKNMFLNRTFIKDALPKIINGEPFGLAFKHDESFEITNVLRPGLIYVPGQTLDPAEFLASTAMLRREDITCHAGPQKFWQTFIAGHELWHLVNLAAFADPGDLPAVLVLHNKQKSAPNDFQLYDESMADVWGYTMAKDEDRDGTLCDLYISARLMGAMHAEGAAPSHHTALPLLSIFQKGYFPDPALVQSCMQDLMIRANGSALPMLMPGYGPHTSLDEAVAWQEEHGALRPAELARALMHILESETNTTPLQRYTVQASLASIHRLCPDALRDLVRDKGDIFAEASSAALPELPPAEACYQIQLPSVLNLLDVPQRDRARIPPYNAGPQQ
ncbi:MAG: hypothetical protein AB7H77_01980 [Bdellovibrionales bacterium]